MVTVRERRERDQFRLEVDSNSAVPETGEWKGQCLIHRAEGNVEEMISWTSGLRRDTPLGTGSGRTGNGDRDKRRQTYVKVSATMSNIVTTVGEEERMMGA